MDDKGDVSDNIVMKDKSVQDTGIIDLCSASKDEDTSNNESCPTEIVNSEEESIQHESESEDKSDGSDGSNTSDPDGWMND